ncbi:MAG TPA: STT3 domain-containing protein, partial [Thermoanaerobaculia bacterium]
MPRRRLALALGLAAAAALGLFLRLHTRAQTEIAGSPRPFGADDAYHLRRAEFAVANFPRTIVFDPLMNFPKGGVPIWPPFYDVILAAPTRLLHGKDAPESALLREAGWIPPLLAAGAIVLLGILGARLVGAAGGIGAAFFLAVAPGHILWTQYAHVDQHAAESFLCLLLLTLFVRSREAARPLAWELSTGAALGLAVLCWQGAIAWGAAIALALFLEAAILR